LHRPAKNNAVIYYNLLSQKKKHLVFFEAPHRVDKFLHDCDEILGDRPVSWCRELTKIHEELTHSTLGNLSASVKLKKIKGESVFIIDGEPAAPALSERKMEQILQNYKLAGNMSLKDSVKKITAEYNLSRSAAYNLALKVWKA
jgi:16S rRNA (cytidine1402-2'-O)-methyltransferase